MKIATSSCPRRCCPKGLAALVLWLLMSCSAADRSWADATGRLTTAVTVKGDIEHELVLSVDDLRRLPVQRSDDTRSRSGPDSASTGTDAVRHYTGCLLRDVLDRAGPIEEHRFDKRKSVIVATASDGYRVVFSWSELYLSPIADGALVVYERDGAPLADDEGRIALISLKDTRPGPRHVKWPQTIELRTLSD